MERSEPDVPPELAGLIAEVGALEDEWRWTEALDAWSRARDATGGDHRLLAECESGRARALFALGRSGEANEADEAAMHWYTEAGEPALAKLAESSLAWRAGMLGDIEDALVVAEEARDAIDQLPDDPSSRSAGARARQMLARILFAADRPDEGERQYMEARDRFADDGDDRRLARCDAALALDLLGAGRLEEAEGRAEAAVAGMVMLDYVVDAAQLQIVLGRIQADSERPEEALGNFGAAAATFRDRELWPAAREAVHLEALMLAMTGEDEPAIARFADAIDLAHSAGLEDGEGATRLELALTLGRLGRFDEATAEFERAAAVLSSAGDQVGAAQATYGIGASRRDAGDLDAALAAFTDVAASFAALDSPGAEAQARFDAATVLEQLGRIDEALALLDLAAEGFATDGQPLLVALVRRAWGTAAGFASRPEGLDALAEARSVFAEHDASWEAALCDDLTARILVSLGRGEEAIVAAEAATNGFRALEDGVTLAASETLLGQLLADGGRSHEAVAHLEEAISMAVDTGVEPLAGHAHEVLSGILESLGRDAEASIHRAAARRLLGEGDADGASDG